jgi:hypothetical protein
MLEEIVGYWLLVCLGTKTLGMRWFEASIHLRVKKLAIRASL